MDMQCESGALMELDVIHVGIQKTASSWLQKAFFSMHPSIQSHTLSTKCVHEICHNEFFEFEGWIDRIPSTFRFTNVEHDKKSASSVARKPEW